MVVLRTNRIQTSILCIESAMLFSNMDNTKQV